MASISFQKPTKALTDALSKRSRSVRRERKGLVAQASVAAAVQRNDLLPEIISKTFEIVSLKRPARDTRKLDPAHVAEVAESIRVNGMVRRPLVSTDGTYIDGVVIAEAAKLLGMTAIPCWVASHLNANQLRALRLNLNRLQEKGEWDLDQLKIELQDLMELDMPLEHTGFSAPEIDIILEQGNEALDENTNNIPKINPDAPAVSRIGDLWILGPHSLFCGDATDPVSYERMMAGAPKAGAVFTDPPYNIPLDGFAVGAGKVHHRDFVEGCGEYTDEEFTGMLNRFLTAVSMHVVDGGALFVCMDRRHATHLEEAARSAKLHHLNTIVWAKGNGGLGGLYRSAYELVLLFKKGDAPMRNNIGLGKHGRDRTNVWTYPGANQRGSSAHAQAANHPTPKPVELVADALLDVTARGDVIIDPFAGSGTSIIAAQSKGRIAHAIELDPLYVDLIIRRFQVFTGIVAVLSEGGKTFKEVAKERAQIGEDAPISPPLQIV